MIETLFPALSLAITVGDSLARSTKQIDDSDGGESVSAVIERDEAKARVAAAVARAQQELAIATRIAAANEVTIEEYFDTSGEGAAGLTTEASEFTLGAKGKGRRVTKRIVKFSGWHADAEQAFTEAATRLLETDSEGA